MFILVCLSFSYPSILFLYSKNSLWSIELIQFLPNIAYILSLVFDPNSLLLFHHGNGILACEIG